MNQKKEKGEGTFPGKGKDSVKWCHHPTGGYSQVSSRRKIEGRGGLRERKGKRARSGVKTEKK